MRIRLAPQARSDLDAIWTNIARETGSEDAATRVIGSITEKFVLFARFPYIGKTLGLDRHPEVRTFPVQQHLVFYRPVAGEIRVLRVIHGNRDVLAVFAPE